MKYTGWVILVPLLLFAIIFGANKGDMVLKLQHQNRDLLEYNRQLELLNVRDAGKITPAECDSRIKEAVIQAKIQKVSPSIPVERSAELATAFLKYSQQYDLDVNLLIAIAENESDFNPKAVSTAGAIGIMQVMPFWSTELDWVLDPSALLDIDKNVHAGAYILREYMDIFHGNRRLALLAYNLGPGTVESRIQNGQDPDNGYAAVILTSYRCIRKD